MPGTRQPEDPIGFLRDLGSRVALLERAQRLQSFIGAQVYKNGNQTITSGLAANTIVNFGTAGIDTDSFFDSTANRLVVPDDLEGYYALYAKIEWETGTDAVRARYRVNNSAYAVVNRSSVNVTTTSHPLPTVVRYMDEGDYFDLGVSHNQGTNRDILGTDDLTGTYIGIRFLGR